MQLMINELQKVFRFGSDKPDRSFISSEQKFFIYKIWFVKFTHISHFQKYLKHNPKLCMILARNTHVKLRQEYRLYWGKNALCEFGVQSLFYHSILQIDYSN